MLDVKPYAAVQAVILDGKRLAATESKSDIWSLTYYAVPTAGFKVALGLEPFQVINVQISDQTWELVPDVLDNMGTAIQPRSEGMMTMPDFDYGTVVVKMLPIDQMR